MLKFPQSRFWERLQIYFENEPGLDAGGLIRNHLGGKIPYSRAGAGGADRDVTDENKKEYLELLLKHYMFKSISEQLDALLMGFYEVMPQFLITVFDYQEFDLLLSGVPELDVND
ncbi:hypothetical protein PsorP6_004781 [Peronosclerospora sorghi]|uniref:Uncharacterized protein n=1 Tax=Peronosclerospora sorghi TaxID=230839 RepID=A0ACC0VN30_9STRA|nr:hypothetical protein PsorP6_004781 [Peronosclerospora sorghi]